MKSIPLPERLARTGELWFENFEPWRWAFARPVWYPRPPAAIPLWAVALAAGIGAAGFAWRVSRPRAENPSATSPGALSLASLFVLMALAANAAYAGLQMAEIHYRTHILSRTWGSLAIAAVVGWAIQSWPRFRTGFLLVPLAFVGLGVWGGVERQDLWVSTWRQHQVELLSIVLAAPALEPGTSIILRSGGTPERYLATEAEYLADSWLILLYDDPALHVLRFTPDRGTGCLAGQMGLECWREQKEACFAAGTCAPDRYPYDKVVILDFEPREGTYRLLADSHDDPLLGNVAAAASRYRPEERIVRRPLSPRQRALVLLQ